MADLAVGLCLMLSLAVTVYRLGLRIGRHSSPASHLGGLLAVAVLAIYCRAFWDQTRLTTILPFSNIIVVGNWFPIIAAFLAGISWSSPAKPLRRLVPVSALVLMSIYATVEPLMGDTPLCGDQWTQDGRCLQTTDSTCAAASCATLLKLYEIPASEQEMASLCLTRAGTRWQGLYRALKQKTEGTDWDVEAVDLQFDEQDMSQLAFPMIVSVGLDQSSPMADYYQREMGLQPDRDHTVVLMRSRATGLIEVADPDPVYGLEKWPLQVVKDLWRGKAFRIVRRDEDLMETALLQIGSLIR